MVSVLQMECNNLHNHVTRMTLVFLRCTTTPSTCTVFEKKNCYVRTL